MAVIGYLLVAIGCIIYLVGAVKFLIAAFNESIVWFICCLIVPFAGLVFLILHWNVAKKPFVTMLIGMVPMVIGAVLMPGSAY